MDSLRCSYGEVDMTLPFFFKQNNLLIHFRRTFAPSITLAAIKKIAFPQSRYSPSVTFLGSVVPTIIFTSVPVHQCIFISPPPFSSTCHYHFHPVTCTFVSHNHFFPKSVSFSSVLLSSGIPFTNSTFPLSLTTSNVNNYFP